MVVSKHVTANKATSTKHRLPCETLQLVQLWKCASATRTMICFLHCQLTCALFEHNLRVIVVCHRDHRRVRM